MWLKLRLVNKDSFSLRIHVHGSEVTKQIKQLKYVLFAKVKQLS